jgi:hypothetical protein
MANKHIDRLYAVTFSDSGVCWIGQKHANGSDEVIAELRLTDLEQVRDLQHLLSWVTRDLLSGDSGE